ncbi:MAG TPA: ABC transporter permease [Gaiellaceae bacterium]|nr:ABC transporter permease [Gaiellaceae bacterium]
MSSTIIPTTRYHANEPLTRRLVAHTRAIVRFRHLVRYLVSTSLRTENTGTVFGFFWWVLDPMLSMAVYTVFIVVIMRRGHHAYPVFVLSALIPWEFFTTAIRNGMALSLSKERAMRQVAFPKGVIPLATTLASAAHFVFAIGVLLIFAVPFGIYPTGATPFLLVIAVVQFVFTLGLTYLFASLNLFFRDTAHLTSYVFRFWFYLSPALYAATLVPARYRHVFSLNPFYTFFNSYRATVFDGQMPHIAPLGILAGVSVLLLLVGFGCFVWSEPKFAKLN